MFGARIVAVANTQGARAAQPVVNKGHAAERAVERAGEGARGWWQRLFALGEVNDQRAVASRTGARSTGAGVAAEPFELRQRPAVRLDPARGIVE